MSSCRLKQSDLAREWTGADRVLGCKDKVGRGVGRRGKSECERKERGGRNGDVVEEEKEKVVMGEVVRVFSANLLFHLCSPPALQPRPAKRHFTSHPHTHGAQASTQEHTHTERKRTHTHKTALSHTLSHDWHMSI